eukprot:gene42028-64782_t
MAGRALVACGGAESRGALSADTWVGRPAAGDATRIEWERAPA